MCRCKELVDDGAILPLVSDLLRDEFSSSPNGGLGFGPVECGSD